MDWNIACLIFGEIPEVGPWLETFADILEQVSNGGYSKDITSCVRLIEQQLDERVLSSTKTFVVYWNTLLTMWNESSLESNFSNTKLDMAVQYAAHYGNKSNQSCTAWNRAESYSSTLISQVVTGMINCSSNCLNSSTFLRTSKIGWNCGTLACQEDFGFLYWVKDLYNGTSDYESRVSYCSQNPCHCEGLGAQGDCI